MVAGGDTRQESVARGLALIPHTIDTVLVHDAARPLTPSIVFDEVLAAVRSRGHGVIPALDVVDTIKRVDDRGRVLETVDRSELAAVQTPQGFPRPALVHAYAVAEREYTDDAALAAAAGMAVDAVPGDARSFKVTLPSDLRRAEALVAGRAHSTDAAGSSQAATAATASASGAAGPGALALPRIGTGVDVHAFADDPNTPLWLAGLHWPGERGLSGHSDGDAASHAVCDALLAAAGLGDVGTVFGTDDPRFEGAHGEVFLTETLRRVREAGFARRQRHAAGHRQPPEARAAACGGRGAALGHPGCAGQRRRDHDRRAGVHRPRRGDRGDRHRAAPPRLTRRRGPRRDRVTPRGAPVGLAGDRATLRLEGPGAA